MKYFLDFFTESGTILFYFAVILYAISISDYNLPIIAIFGLFCSLFTFIKNHKK